MSATVIPKLEPSDRPGSPGLFPQLSEYRGTEDRSPGRMRDLSDVWDVSQSGVPIEEDDVVNNCTLDLSMRSSEWNAQSPPSYPAEENDVNDVSSSCEDDKVADAAARPETSALDLSTNSDNSNSLSVLSLNNGDLPVGLENTNNGNLNVKIENTLSYDDVPDEPVNSVVVSVLPENSSYDCESVIRETASAENVIPENVPVSNVSNRPESSDLINITDSPQNNVVMDLQSDEASEVINVTETDEDVINVTSTTQESEPADTPVSPEQEVVDVESYQPCVVDLTCEEEDDVDVVAVVEPVIFIGTGHGRRNRGNNPPPQVEDLTDAHDHGEAIDDDIDERNNEMWRMLNPPEIDLQNPNLTFGSLLEQVHIETVEDNSIQQPHRPLATSRRTYRELRRTTRRQRRSRSRSPNLFPDMDFDDNQPHIANLMHAIDDIMHDGGDWTLPLDAPNQLPLDANQVVAEEHHHRVARIPPPRPPPSPPPVEQPTISCLVCLDSIATINSSSRSLCSTVCGHVFCSACIEEVVKQRKQCPVCRKRLTKKQYHPLFI